MEAELAASLARKLGLAFDMPVVLGEGMNVLVHLRPTPVVARVTRLAHLVRMNANSIESAMRMVEGTARSMGVEVV